MTTTDLLSAYEAAEILECHPSTVYRLIEDGLIPVVRVRRIRQRLMKLRRSDVVAFRDHDSKE